MKKVIKIAVWLLAMHELLGFLSGQGRQGYVVNPVLLISSLWVMFFLTIPVIGFLFFGRKA